MDVEMQAEILLRQEGYRTWVSSSSPVPTVGFENETVLGFLHVFPDAGRLVDAWENVQRVTLARHQAALRTAGAKAWNVYTVFLTAGQAGELAGVIERIEEDFSLTRKIARSGVGTPTDLRRALMPLTPLRTSPQIGRSDYFERLRARLTDIPAEAVSAFLGGEDEYSVARILAGAQ
ncbi:hypothetical protein MKK75_00580 [Methylobacterium sp. J-030]|uniref:hypothetical protein n=1 Tax=Methylobacterium sp. J-030 TaxID=2836627 RepID=UPI001FBADEC8|nr:hypothetical protein [Methylobacterium sp. J-030]MCJ2067317.1 hypothetical protein [Methylobacterium sp. J-030]